MAGSLNRVTLIGNLGKDPEVRSFANGGKVCNFSIATSEQWKDKDGNKQERTQWHNIVVFNEGLIGVIERFVKKGSKLFVSGQLETRKYQDQAGADRYSTEVVLRNFNSELILLDGRQGGDGGQASPSGGSSGGGKGLPAPSDIDDDSIPF